MIALLLATAALASSTDMIVMGGLERRVVADTLDRQAPKFHACEKLYATKKTRIALRFVIDNKGKTKHVGIASESKKIPRLDRCVKAVVRGTIFPEPQGGGIVEVDYPLELGKK